MATRPFAFPRAPNAGWAASLRPFPFEIFALLHVVAAVVFLRSHHLRMDGRGFSYIVRPLLEELPIFLLVGLGPALVATAVARRPIQAFLARRARPGWLFHWLRLWIGVILVTYGYGWLKVNVPIVNPALWDAELWRLDAWLHFGFSPSVFVTQLVAGTPLVDLLDAWYGHWITTVVVTLCFLTVYLPRPAARRFVFGMLLIWALGSWLYVAVPALGPIYAFPEAWQDLVLPRALGAQADLWQNYQIMVGGRTGQIYSFNPIKGVAAMPSLHVGVYAYFTMWSLRNLRPLWVVFFLATLLTFLGSILTGWHYAVDGYVGIGLAWVCYHLSRRFAAPPRPGEEEEEAETPETETRETQAFAGRSVLLTGASSGIGREMALLLAEAGARLALAARRVERLEAVAEACRERGAEDVAVLSCDVTSEEDCRRAVEATVGRFGGLDVLVANAGQTLWGLFEDFETLEPLRKVMEVNYFGSVHCTRWALPHLKASEGQIVVVSSLTGKTGVPTRSGYAASKHALHGFFDTLRIELRGGVSGKGVDVTIACPDFVATETRERAWGTDGERVGESPVKEGEIMPAKECARRILRGAARRKRELILSRRGKLGLLLKFFAPSLVDRIAARAIRRGR